MADLEMGLALDCDLEVELMGRVEGIRGNASPLVLIMG